MCIRDRTMNDAAAVAALRERYNALSSADQAKVTNVSTLTAAEAKIEELKAADRGYQALMRKIEDMPSPVTLANKQMVDELAAQYDALSSEDQQKVENSSKLSKAREDLSFYLENFAFPEDSPFTYQTINTDGLYLLTSPNNMAGCLLYTSNQPLSIS